jgi:hypothetical protein
VVDSQLDFATDPCRQAGEHAEGIDDTAIGRILNRDDPIIDVLAAQFFEHGRDGGDRYQFCGAAKAFDGRQVAIAVGGAEVGDSQRLGQCPHAAVQFAEDRAHRMFRKRALAGFQGLLGGAMLAVEIVQRSALGMPQSAQFFAALGILVQQFDQIAAQLIGLSSQGVRGRRGIRLFLGFALLHLQTALFRIGGGITRHQDRNVIAQPSVVKFSLPHSSQNPRFTVPKWQTPATSGASRSLHERRKNPQSLAQK